MYIVRIRRLWLGQEENGYEFFFWERISYSYAACDNLICSIDMNLVNLFW